VFKLEKGDSAPIYSLKAHESDVTLFKSVGEGEQFLTGSKDKTLALWLPPRTWTKNDDLMIGSNFKVEKNT
jgi:hypothetical protein